MKKFSIVLLAFAATLAQAQVKVGKDAEQKFKVNGMVANAAIGPAAKAEQNINSVSGNVSIGGNLKQDFNVNGMVANAAIGPGASAKQKLNHIEGK